MGVHVHIPETRGIRCPADNHNGGALHNSFRLSPDSCAHNQKRLNRALQIYRKVSHVRHTRHSGALDRACVRTGVRIGWYCVGNGDSCAVINFYNPRFYPERGEVQL